MHVQINGTLIELRQGVSLLAWFEEQKIPLESAIAEYNGEIIPQEHWLTTILKEGDQVEILKFVGGGR